MAIVLKNVLDWRRICVQMLKSWRFVVQSLEVWDKEAQTISYHLGTRKKWTQRKDQQLAAWPYQHLWCGGSGCWQCSWISHGGCLSFRVSLSKAAVLTSTRLQSGRKQWPLVAAIAPVSVDSPGGQRKGKQDHQNEIWISTGKYGWGIRVRGWFLKIHDDEIQRNAYLPETWL